MQPTNLLFAPLLLIILFFEKKMFFRFNFFTPNFKDMTLRYSQITGQRREQGCRLS